MKTIGRMIIGYLALVGLAVHLALGGVWYFDPALGASVSQRVLDAAARGLEGASRPVAGGAALSDGAVFGPLPPWQPLPPAADAPPPGMARIGGRLFVSVTEGFAALRPGDTLNIGQGVYDSAAVISTPGTTIVGQGEVRFERGTAQGKANLVVAADQVTVRNIECSLIQVPDGNGACIRQEGRNLTLDHVYFHDSEQGLLTVANPGRVLIRDSRFERLGRGGQSHGIYVGGGELVITDSLFLASQGEGHEIKTRAAKTTIERSVIASLSGVDSRLIDAPAGGLLTILDSVLQQGPNSANGDVVGFALETGPGPRPADRVVMRNNLVISDRPGPSRLLHLKDPGTPVDISGNLIVSAHAARYVPGNTVFRDRAAAGLPPYPALPLAPPARPAAPPR